MKANEIITNKEFKDIIREIKTRIAQYNGFNRKHREEVFNLLDSLRPQNTWKHSDEHYELKEFAKIVRGNLTGISKAVQELFEAKYLQLTSNKMYGGFKD